MPLPISRHTNNDDYDSDPEIQAEKELAKKDPNFQIDENSLISQKKREAEAEVSSTPPNVVGGNHQFNKIRTTSTTSDEFGAKKQPKTGNQTKALKKQRSRGISGCSSKKFAGYDDEDYDMDDYDEDELFDDYEEDEQDTTKTA
ncbi:unnamed protein product [Caenorhabditis angaria]|uniref:Uncharacterized protein n=1 Tax=Caenorhabditis angaria TaxID=860376 RepID=A0A9P1IWQ8_9PELO|nr:unnamed protein product [Caenorhabditis angaria]